MARGGGGGWARRERAVVARARAHSGVGDEDGMPVIVPCDRSRSGHAGRQTHAFERGRALASRAFPPPEGAPFAAPGFDVHFSGGNEKRRDVPGGRGVVRAHGRDTRGQGRAVSS